MNQSVPLVDLRAQHLEVAEEIKAGWEDVLATTAFIGGRQVADFEHAYAEFIGVDHCIGVANGTDALELALRAVGVDADSEVIIPANTFIATAEAVARIGAEAVMVDVDPIHLLIDPDLVSAAVTDKTRAIVPVHLFGQVAPVERLTTIAHQCGAVIVEDAAQAQGALRFGQHAGSLGKVSCTSFYPGKNLGAAGDAGAVLTDDPEIARRVRLLGAHGSEHKYVHEALGFNSRLDTLQAVVLHAKLGHLDHWNDLRRRAAGIYEDALSDLPGVKLPRSSPGNLDVWHLYVIRVPERDRVLNALQSAGIGAAIHYPTPVHLTAPFRSSRSGHRSFPVAERASREILSIPLHPHLTLQAQMYVIDVLRATLKAL